MEDNLIEEYDDDWIEKIYYEDGIKITRYKPSWYKNPDKFNSPIKGNLRKPIFGPKDP
ncbi:uncharacterized protein METZ01_LOCUS130385 [marine metagenome]|uniref:Uncharacterized protein n=1 Tax=marine metagenome TaxID=408172 RepID=A0A381YLT2_9ZZZZ